MIFFTLTHFLHFTFYIFFYLLVQLFILFALRICVLYAIFFVFCLVHELMFHIIRILIKCLRFKCL